MYNNNYTCLYAVKTKITRYNYCYNNRLVFIRGHFSRACGVRRGKSTRNAVLCKNVMNEPRQFQFVFAPGRLVSDKTGYRYKRIKRVQNGPWAIHATSPPCPRHSRETRARCRLPAAAAAHEAKISHGVVEPPLRGEKNIDSDWRRGAPPPRRTRVHPRKRRGLSPPHSENRLNVLEKYVSKYLAEIHYDHWRVVHSPVIRIGGSHERMVRDYIVVRTARNADVCVGRGKTKKQNKNRLFSWRDIKPWAFSRRDTLAAENYTVRIVVT